MKINKILATLGYHYGLDTLPSPDCHNYETDYILEDWEKDCVGKRYSNV